MDGKVENRDLLQGTHWEFLPKYQHSEGTRRRGLLANQHPDALLDVTDEHPSFLSRVLHQQSQSVPAVLPELH